MPVGPFIIVSWPRNHSLWADMVAGRRTTEGPNKSQHNHRQWQTRPRVWLPLPVPFWVLQHFSPHPTWACYLPLFVRWYLPLSLFFFFVWCCLSPSIFGTGCVTFTPPPHGVFLALLHQHKERRKRTICGGPPTRQGGVCFFTTSVSLFTLAFSLLSFFWHFLKKRPRGGGATNTEKVECEGGQAKQTANNERAMMKTKRQMTGVWCVARMALEKYKLDQCQGGRCDMRWDEMSICENCWDVCNQEDMAKE